MHNLIWLKLTHFPMLTPNYLFEFINGVNPTLKSFVGGKLELFNEIKIWYIFMLSKFYLIDSCFSI